MIIFFDTETTGLIPGNVIQLAYVMARDEKVESKCFFFAVDNIEPSAVAVHGFTPEILARLSNGRVFSDYADEIYEDFSTADLIVAHNVKFDVNFMIAEFIYMSRTFRYKESFDTMKFFTPIMKMPRANGKGYKYPKLTELADFLGVTSDMVAKKTGELFGTDAVKGHDARYDTALLYLCFLNGAEKYPSLGQIRDDGLKKEV